MDRFGLLSAMFVYSDAGGHMTRLQPPDWLLSRIAVSCGTMGIVSLFGFPRVSLMAAEAM